MEMSGEASSTAPFGIEEIDTNHFDISNVIFSSTDFENCVRCVCVDECNAEAAGAAGGCCGGGGGQICPEIEKSSIYVPNIATPTPGPTVSYHLAVPSFAQPPQWNNHSSSSNSSTSGSSSSSGNGGGGGGSNNGSNSNNSNSSGSSGSVVGTSSGSKPPSAKRKNALKFRNFGHFVSFYCGFEKAPALMAPVTDDANDHTTAVGTAICKSFTEEDHSESEKVCNNEESRRAIYANDMQQRCQALTIQDHESSRLQLYVNTCTATTAAEISSGNNYRHQHYRSQSQNCCNISSHHHQQQQQYMRSINRPNCASNLITADRLLQYHKPISLLAPRSGKSSRPSSDRSPPPHVQRKSSFRTFVRMLSATLRTGNGSGSDGNNLDRHHNRGGGRRRRRYSSNDCSEIRHNDRPTKIKSSTCDATRNNTSSCLLCARATRYHCTPPHCPNNRPEMRRSADMWQNFCTQYRPLCATSQWPAFGPLAERHNFFLCRASFCARCSIAHHFWLSFERDCGGDDDDDDDDDDGHDHCDHLEANDRRNPRSRRDEIDRTKSIAIRRLLQLPPCAPIEHGSFRDGCARCAAILRATIEPAEHSFAAVQTLALAPAPLCSQNDPQQSGYLSAPEPTPTPSIIIENVDTNRDAQCLLPHSSLSSSSSSSTSSSSAAAAAAATALSASSSRLLFDSHRNVSTIIDEKVEPVIEDIAFPAPPGAFIDYGGGGGEERVSPQIKYVMEK